MLRRAARLPDPLVGLAPHLRRALRLGLDDRPQPARQPVAAAGVEQDRVEHRAEHVVLALVERAVADPDRPRSGVAREVVPRGLRQVPAAVDPVHDLERAVLVGLEVGDELHELVRLPVEVEEVQRLEREGRVAHPGEAVVPVALTARGLRQGGGQRRHRRPGRHVGEALDRERRALNRVAPAVVRETGPPEPPTPEPRRCREPGVGLVDVLRRRQLLGPRERAVDLVALLDHVPGPHPVTLDADRHVGLEPDRLTCPARIGRVAVLADQRPLRRHAAVIEHGLADQLDLDPAVEAQDRAHQHVVAVLVGRRPGVGRDQCPRRAARPWSGSRARGSTRSASSRSSAGCWSPARTPRPQGG